MTDIDTLRPEVREAVLYYDQPLDDPDPHWDTIRAELLRLASMEHTWQQWIKDGMRVEFLPLELPK